MVKTVPSTIVLSFLLSLSVALSGCQQQKQPPPPKVDTSRSHDVKKETSVVVPDAVKGKWKAVKITVIDKKAAKENIYTIPIGEKYKLPGSAMSIEVETFLPAFIMEGSSITSASNELKNPAAKVILRETNTGVFKGWMFARYPTTHAFVHPRFSFALIDAVPVTRR